MNLAEIGCGVLTQNLARKFRTINLPLLKYECLFPILRTSTTPSETTKTTASKRLQTIPKTPDFLIKKCEFGNEIQVAGHQETEEPFEKETIINEFNFKRISPEFFDLLRRHESHKNHRRFKKVKRSDFVCMEEALNPNDLANTHPKLAAHMAETMKNASIANYIYDINFYDETRRKRVFKQSHLDLNYILYMMDVLRTGVRRLTAEELDDIKWLLTYKSDIDPRILANILRLLCRTYPGDPFFAQQLNQVLNRLKNIGKYISEYYGFNKDSNKSDQYGKSRFSRYSSFNLHGSTDDIDKKIRFKNFPHNRNEIAKRGSFIFKPVLFHEPFSSDKVETWRAQFYTNRNRMDTVTEKKIDLGSSRSYLMNITPYDRRPSYGGPIQSRPSVSFDPTFSSYRHSISPEHKTVSKFFLQFSDNPYENKKRLKKTLK